MKKKIFGGELALPWSGNMHEHDSWSGSLNDEYQEREGSKKPFF